MTQEKGSKKISQREENKLVAAWKELYSKQTNQYNLLNALWSNHLKANKKVMSLETKCWHLEWKVEYLEKKLKQIDPNVGLYERDEDDPYEKEKEERQEGCAEGSSCARRLRFLQQEGHAQSRTIGSSTGRF